MSGDRALPPAGNVPARCAHPRRVRENRWGWFGAETICVTCGQGFDPEQEARLRRGEPTTSLPADHPDPTTPRSDATHP